MLEEPLLFRRRRSSGMMMIRLRRGYDCSVRFHSVHIFLGMFEFNLKKPNRKRLIM